MKELAPFIGGAKGGSAGFLAENELAELGVAGEVAEVLGTLACGRAISGGARFAGIDGAGVVAFTSCRFVFGGSAGSGTGARE